MNNLSLLRKYLKYYENNDQNKINSCLHKKYVYTAPGGTLSLHLADRIADEGLFFAAFRVIHVKLKNHIEENDKIACHIIMKCRHIGNYQNIERTNKLIEISYMEIIQIKDNRIFREWAEFDMASILNQLK
jgi:predicted ester cyclase